MSDTLDLQHKTCPETFLFTKMALENCPSGSSLQVKYANEDTAQRVRSSLILEGFEATLVSAVDDVADDSTIEHSTNSSSQAPACSLKILVPNR